MARNRERAGALLETLGRLVSYRGVAARCVYGWLVAATVTTLGCGRSTGDTSSSDGVAQNAVIYCSADKEFAELIFKAYEAKTGVKVLPLYDTEETKTAGLTSRLVAEKERPKADVFWSSDTSRAVALVEQGIAAAYVPKEAAAIPARYKSQDGMWTGFGARIRVLLYNTNTVKPHEVPRSIVDLTRPRWRGASPSPTRILARCRSTPLRCSRSGETPRRAIFCVD